MAEEISIPLFDAEDMKVGRGGGRRGGGQKYSKYAAAIEGSIGFLKDSIAGSRDGTIRVRVADLAKQMGLTGKHETSIYWGLKYTLFQRGIFVTTGKTKADEPVLIMRIRREGDTLPASLAKHLGAGAGEMKGEAGAGAEEEEEMS